MPLNPYPRQVNVPATNDVQADLKAQALATLAANLNLESLQTLATASKKPGADGKLKTYKAFL